MIGDSTELHSDDETNFPHKLLLTNRQITNLSKAFANKSSEIQIPKMVQSGGFLGKLLGPLLKTGLPLIKNVIQPLAKRVTLNSFRVNCNSISSRCRNT